MSLRRLAALTALVGVLAPTSAALARGTVTLVDLEDEVNCVVCKRPLATSGGSAADDERAVIQGLIDQGLSKAQIKDRLVAEYGKAVLVDDKNPATAIAPVAAAIIGVGSITLLLRRRRAGTAPDPSAPAAGAAPGPDPEAPAPAALSADDEVRIDAELAEPGRG